MKKHEGPKVLLLDIETTPILGYCWGLWDNNVALNQIYKDWEVLSWSAKWYTDKAGRTYGPHSKVMYNDVSTKTEKTILKSIWTLIDRADILITQNGIDFDSKKLNARFLLNGMKPPSPVRHIDTLKIARKHFALTSNKLEYTTGKLCFKHKKMKTKKFQGFELWAECLKGNKAAFKEMKEYNCKDVLSLEELYHVLQPWESSIRFDTYFGTNELSCNCGSTSFNKRGFAYTPTGKFQIYHCSECGSFQRSKLNLLSKDKKKSLLT